MRALRTIFFAAIAALSGDCRVLAASKPAQRPACEGVDIRLPPARIREYAGLVAQSVTTKVKPSQVSVHSFIASGPWSAVSASMSDSEDGFFFFKETRRRKQFKEVWGGWADPSEKSQLIGWAAKLGAPTGLAACFSDVATHH
jgi:hypothetical protein